MELGPESETPANSNETVCRSLSQGENLDELRHHLAEVISMLIEDGEAEIEADFVGTQTFVVG